jgi:cytochrome c oxidase assembly protein subunit 15
MPVYVTAHIGQEARQGWTGLIAAWLLVCAAMIFSMVVLGGVTRLTGSGLSMVEWDPIFGAVPPLSEETWQQTFDKYKESPEYRKVNYHMDLAGFERIYWVEYAHRVLGRAIGVVFLIPLLAFVALRKVPRDLVPRLFGIFLLGGLQGLLGWYMVKSGLVDNPHVSQYRLTAHLMLAVMIYGYILWVALGLMTPRQEPSRPAAGLRALAYGVVGLVALTMTSGGFVAGLRAGLAFNTFPLMGGRWVPEGVGALEPWYRNLFENIATVQFDHRVLALITLASVIALWVAALRARLAAGLRWGVHALLLLAALQVTLGISTLLLHVPVPLASAHQAVALLVLTAALFVAQRMGASPERVRSSPAPMIGG